MSHFFHYLTILSLILISTSTIQAQTQKQTSIQIGTAFMSENNLGDHGVLVHFAATRQLKGRLDGRIGLGSFTMLGTNEKFGGINDQRSLSFAYGELAIGYNVIKASKINWSIFAGGAARVGRQLWPALIEIGPSGTKATYEMESLNAIGLSTSSHLAYSINSKIDLSLDVVAQHYGFLFETMGAGLSLKFKI